MIAARGFVSFVLRICRRRCRAVHTLPFLIDQEAIRPGRMEPLAHTRRYNNIFSPVVAFPNLVEENTLSRSAGCHAQA